MLKVDQYSYVRAAYRLHGKALAYAGLTEYRDGISIRHGYFYHILFAAITACVLYVTLEIEYPRYEIVRLDMMNHVLVELAETMK